MFLWNFEVLQTLNFTTAGWLLLIYNISDISLALLSTADCLSSTATKNVSQAIHSVSLKNI